MHDFLLLLIIITFNMQGIKIKSKIKSYLEQLINLKMLNHS